MNKPIEEELGKELTEVAYKQYLSLKKIEEFKDKDIDFLSFSIGYTLGMYATFKNN